MLLLTSRLIASLTLYHVAEIQSKGKSWFDIFGRCCPSSSTGRLASQMFGSSNCGIHEHGKLRGVLEQLPVFELTGESKPRPRSEHVQSCGLFPLCLLCQVRPSKLKGGVNRNRETPESKLTVRIGPAQVPLGVVRSLSHGPQNRSSSQFPSNGFRLQKSSKRCCHFLLSPYWFGKAAYWPSPVLIGAG